MCPCVCVCGVIMPGYLLRTRGVTCRSRYKNIHTYYTHTEAPGPQPPTGAKTLGGFDHLSAKEAPMAPRG